MKKNFMFVCLFVTFLFPAFSLNASTTGSMLPEIDKVKTAVLRDLNNKIDELNSAYKSGKIEININFYPEYFCDDIQNKNVYDHVYALRVYMDDSFWDKINPVTQIERDLTYLNITNEPKIVIANVWFQVYVTVCGDRFYKYHYASKLYYDRDTRYYMLYDSTSSWNAFYPADICPNLSPIKPLPFVADNNGVLVSGKF